MNSRWLALLILAVPAPGTGRHWSGPQTPDARAWSRHVVIPQARSYAWGQSPVLQITRVTVGVVIRDQVASTMMEVRLRNPGAVRQEAELLLRALGLSGAAGGRSSRP